MQNDMDQQHLQQRRQIHQRRLHWLEVQAAHYGAATPPHIHMEIEAIQAQLAAIPAQADQRSALAEPPALYRMLFLSAEPADLPRLRLGHELRAIKERLQRSQGRHRIDFYQREALRPTDLSQAIGEIRPHIVHFAGHGNAAGALYFENEVGNAQAVTADAFAALLQLAGGEVNCLILNACHSAAQLVNRTQAIEFVIGMGDTLTDDTAIAFATGFYQALGAGAAISAAYHLGCTQIALQGLPTHNVPILYQTPRSQSPLPSPLAFTR